LIGDQRVRLAAARVRRRVWLPGVVAALAIAALMAVVVGSGGSPRTVSLKPSQAQVARDMEHTTLIAEPLEHFFPAGDLKTTSDGSGGHLTAAVGTIVPTTDGDGQLVFFWHNSRFIGWDAPFESMAIQALQSVGVGRFRVTYSNYAPGDAACCPSLIPVSVIYRWHGRRFAVEGNPPTVRPIPARVRFSG
jgi:hypothetical protein